MESVTLEFPAHSATGWGRQRANEKKTHFLRCQEHICPPSCKPTRSFPAIFLLLYFLCASPKERSLGLGIGGLGSAERPLSSLHQKGVAWLQLVNSKHFTWPLEAEGRSADETRATTGVQGGLWLAMPYPGQRKCFEGMKLKCQGRLNGSQRSPLGSPDSVGLAQI